MKKELYKAVIVSDELPFNSSYVPLRLDSI